MWELSTIFILPPLPRRESRVKTLAVADGDLTTFRLLLGLWQKHLPGRLQKLRIKAKVSERDEYVNFSERIERIERAELLCFGPSLNTLEQKDAPDQTRHLVQF